MLALLLLATTINYVDRSNLSIVAPFLSKELGLGPVQMGLLFSAFAWSYAIANLPGGFLIDRFGSQLAVAIVRIVTDDPTRTVGSQIHENIRRIIGTCLAERAMTKILFTDAVGIDPLFDRKLASFYENMVLLLVETLKDGQKLGIVADGEPRVLAYMALGALKELLYQAVTLGFAEESAEVLTQQIYTFLCDGCLRVR